MRWWLRIGGIGGGGFGCQFGQILSEWWQRCEVTAMVVVLGGDGDCGGGDCSSSGNRRWRGSVDSEDYSRKERNIGFSKIFTLK